MCRSLYPLVVAAALLALLLSIAQARQSDPQAPEQRAARITVNGLLQYQEARGGLIDEDDPLGAETDALLDLLDTGTD